MLDILLVFYFLKLHWPEMMVISSVTATDQTIVSLFFSDLPVVILAVGWPNTQAGVYKRCRLSLLTNSALVYEPKSGGGGELRLAGSQPISTAAHRSPIKLWRSTSILNLCSQGITTHIFIFLRGLANRRQVDSPVLVFQTLMVSMLPVARESPPGCQARQRIRPSCLSST